MIESFRLLNQHGAKLWLGSLLTAMTVFVLLVVPLFFLGIMLGDELVSLKDLLQSRITSPESVGAVVTDLGMNVLEKGGWNPRLRCRGHPIDVAGFRILHRCPHRRGTGSGTGRPGQLGMFFFLRLFVICFASLVLGDLVGTYLFCLFCWLGSIVPLGSMIRPHY